MKVIMLFALFGLSLCGDGTGDSTNTSGSDSTSTSGGDSTSTSGGDGTSTSGGDGTSGGTDASGGTSGGTGGVDGTGGSTSGGVGSSGGTGGVDGTGGSTGGSTSGSDSSSGGTGGGGGTSGESDCPNKKVSDPAAKNCLIQALKNLGFFLPAVGKYACAYDQYGADGNKKNYIDASTTFVHALKCTGCQADQFFGKGHTFEEILKGLAESGSDSLELVLNVLEKVGIEKTKTAFVCAVAGKLLQSQCIQKALTSSAPGVVTGLIKLYCQLKKSGATDASAQTVNLLTNLRCGLVEATGLDDKKLQEALGALGDGILQKLIENLLIFTKDVNLAAKLACLLLNPLGGGIGILPGI